VIRLELTTAKCVRVIGALNGPALHILSKTLSARPVVLDVSEVSQADQAAVRLLASLAPEQCTLAGCPTWLSLWIERLRRAEPATGDGER
jgi:ABC-type transporter Mla MlaB component